jgi:hypothetical protein
MKQLAVAFEAHQARLDAAIAQAAPGESRDHLSKLKSLLTDTYKQFVAESEKNKQALAEATRSMKEAIQTSQAKVEEMIRNAPKPKPRPAKRGIVHDPLLEEKLQLALQTPFGNRVQQPQ